MWVKVLITIVVVVIIIVVVVVNIIIIPILVSFLSLAPLFSSGGMNDSPSSSSSFSRTS